MNARARSSDILMLSKMQDASVKVAEEGGREGGGELTNGWSG